MLTAESIKQLLDIHSIPYSLIEHGHFNSLQGLAEEQGFSLLSAVRLTHFEHADDHFITLVPVTRVLDIVKLQDQLTHDVALTLPANSEQPVSDESMIDNFPQTTLIFDKSLENLDEITIPLSPDESFITLSGTHLNQLRAKSRILDFSVAVEDILNSDFSDGLNFRKKRIIGRIEDIEGLPAMPEMGYRILQASRDPESDASDLAKVIEVDPSLSAQVMSYSTSAFYGYQGEISSVRDAISRVLGFELVANMAVGIALGNAFKIPSDGPLGLSCFWRDAVYSAALVEKLAKSLPPEMKIKPGLAYLCGLLHNFGHLLVGHLYSPGFKILNQLVSANPDIDINVLERFSLGTTHNDIGACLLEKWQMPDETIQVCKWHHAENGQELSTYVHLVKIIDQMLWRQGVGDTISGELPVTSLNALQMNEEEVLAVIEPMLDTCTELDNLATQLAG